jgi:nucleotide-binding universal stress UspA family protein
VDANDGADTQEVVVGVDGTATALRAVGWAASEARLRERPLRIVHAAPYTATGGRQATAHADGILRHALTVAHDREPDLTVHLALTDDEPVPALVRTSREAGLLVIGMISGRPGEVIIGSVAPALSGRTSCPVTVVRGPHHSPTTGHPVLLGVADIAADAAAISFAFADAERHGTRLTVLHALHSRPGTGSDTDAAAALTDDLEPWRIMHPGVPVEVRVTHDTAVQELLNLAAGARLVVVGTRDRSAALRTVLGSCSRELVRNSPCPVTVVRRGAPRTEPTPAGHDTTGGDDPRDRSQP